MKLVDISDDCYVHLIDNTIFIYVITNFSIIISD